MSNPHLSGTFHLFNEDFVLYTKIFVFISQDPVSYYNPLHIAVLRNRPNMVKLLAGHGADIEKRDRVSKEESMTSLLIDSVFFFNQ